MQVFHFIIMAESNYASCTIYHADKNCAYLLSTLDSNIIISIHLISIDHDPCCPRL